MQQCSFCQKQVYRLLAKGLCAACYNRQRKHGTPDYVKVRKPCSVEGCNRLSVAQNLCDLHYRRLKKRGVVEAERFDRWGHAKNHPLYQSWSWKFRKQKGTEVCSEWQDFWQFVRDVGDRPTPKHRLVRLDKTKPHGPGNVTWREPLTDITTVEKKDRAEWMRVYRIDNPRKFKDFSLRQSYGITLDAYEALEKVQSGVCAICKRPETKMHPVTGVAKYLAVDHCHNSHKIRGLLCQSCNQGLGRFDDDINRLETAIAYLRKHGV